MRNIDVETIISTVEELFVSSNRELEAPECAAVISAYDKEESAIGKTILKTIAKNLDAAKKAELPICQDTGMAVVFAEIGQDVRICGGSFEKAVNTGVSRAYTNGKLRASVVRDPVFGRTNTKDNTPAVIHARIVDGDRIKITAAPKGFGSENMSAVRMMSPTSTKEEIVAFVVETVKNAGSNPCPPIHVGVGIGGTFEYAPYLAKLALIRGINVPNSDDNYAALEREMLVRINELGIGPQGFGGKVTALGVNIEFYPTHIAGLPVAVNINCHVMRHKSAVI